jgi:hypothetical protein
MSVELAEEGAVEVDTSPARLSSAVATVAAALAVLISAPLSVFALPLGVGGFVVFLVALFGAGSRSLLWFGCVALFVSVVVAGTLGSGPPALLLTSVAATLLAWDIGQNAISVGEQLGNGATTWRSEVVHGAADQPVTALLLLLAAGLLLTWALRSQGRYS